MKLDVGCRGPYRTVLRADQRASVRNIRSTPRDSNSHWGAHKLSAWERFCVIGQFPSTRGRARLHTRPAWRRYIPPLGKDLAVRISAKMDIYRAHPGGLTGNG